MPKQKDPRDHPSEIHDPYYREILETAVRKAKELLWQRLQHGKYQDDEEARAVMEAYWALRKVVALLEQKIRQIPLPEKKEETPATPADDLPPSRIGLLPQEAGR